VNMIMVNAWILYTYTGTRTNVKKKYKKQKKEEDRKDTNAIFLQSEPPSQISHPNPGSLRRCG